VEEEAAAVESSASEVSSSSRAASSSSSSVSFSASRWPDEMIASTRRFDGLEGVWRTRGGASLPTPPAKSEEEDGDATEATTTLFPLSFFTEPSHPFNTPNPYPFLSFFTLMITSSA